MKEQKLTFGIGANIKGNFTSSFSKASETMINLNSALNKINGIQKQNTTTLQKYMKTISSSSALLKPLKNELKSLSETMESSKSKMQQLEEKIKKGGRGSKSAAREYTKLKNEVHRLQNEYDKKLSNANKIESKIEKEREEVQKLTESYKKNAIALKKVEALKKVHSLANKSGEIGKNISSAGTKIAGAGAIGMGALTPSIYAAIKAESSFADVKKQFDFKDKDDENNFKKKLEDLVTEKKLAVSIPELYAAAAAAGQSGIGKDEAINYVEQGIKTGIAFDVGKDEASKSLFMLKNAFNLTFEKLSNLTDVINMLGNTTGANAADITDFVSRVGNIGTVAGFTTDQIAALGATLIEQGMTPEIAATGAEKLMGSMTKGFAASKSQQQAFNMLGLDSEYLAKSAQTDAEGTILKIFDRLGKLRADKQGAVITLLFGEEGKRGATGVLKNKDQLLSNLKNSKNKNLYSGSIQQEADIRGNTMENKLQVLKSILDIRMAKMGEILFPDLENLLKQFGNILESVEKFQKENPKLFSGLVKGVAYGSAALLGLGATAKIVSFGVGSLSKVFEVYGWLIEKEVALKGKTALLKLLATSKTVFVGLGTGLKTTALAVSGFLKTATIGLARFGVSLLANPITWYVAAIMAVVGAGYLLYKNFDLIKEKSKEAWAAIIQACQPVMDMWNTIKGKVAEVYVSWKDGAIDFKNSFKEALNGVFSWVTEKFQTLLNLKDKFLNFASNTWNSGKKIVKNIPGFADGGIVNNPTLAMIGEGNYSETIIPHNKNQRSLNLWEKTGKIIGAYDKNNNTVQHYNSPIQFTFAPTIHSNDSKSIEKEIEKQKDLAFREFEKMYERLIKEKQRRGYGR
ncbi:phage tail tape measure protein, TP901 family, core region [Cetobacterium ceti]|uniref:Phage tail tape measure protein, TP901 family, core region n=1 Tax=Cetobacterium ceti TaxID=180163 RepID=A0A1T4QE70_9FUSO|nr:phage tail tape measure protein [Cetobacterium ceti]SKA01801.1 phage tail tape measure protein, TP901 family, core region [Cetobacterium ceti]